MTRSVNWWRNSRTLLLWVTLIIRFNGSSTSMYFQNQEPSHTEPLNDQRDTDWYLTFLRSKPVTSSEPVRPYLLSLNVEDYHYTPKPKHLRPRRLLRVLGSSFDPFWMSIQRPSEEGVWALAGENDAAKSGQTGSHGHVPNASLPNYTVNKVFNLSASPELTEGAARYQRKLEKETEDLDLSSLPLNVVSSVRNWLVSYATCGLRYKWVDMGPVFWPRWLRHTDCEMPGASQSCSFPSGMACRRAQVTHLKILAFHCTEHEDEDGVGLKGIAVSDRVIVVGSGPSGKKCMWRQVPYPVVTACKCSCKEFL
ncbi:noggin-like [Osmerus mordax]|uniref:noggin-like n=1 Tax=Osmerus mordax TaxID=8014 RepID=UPI00350F73B8